MWYRYGFTHVAEHLNVKCQRLFHQLTSLLDGVGSRDASWNIGGTGGVVRGLTYLTHPAVRSELVRKMG
jgi:hypothetical protein